MPNANLWSSKPGYFTAIRYQQRAHNQCLRTAWTSAVGVRILGVYVTFNLFSFLFHSGRHRFSIPLSHYMFCSLFFSPSCKEKKTPKTKKPCRSLSLNYRIYLKNQFPPFEPVSMFCIWRGCARPPHPPHSLTPEAYPTGGVKLYAVMGNQKVNWAVNWKMHDVKHTYNM